MDVTAEAPSPDSANDSDFEMPDAFAQPPEPKPAEKHSSSMHAMDLDSRITSFLAGGNQSGLV